MHRFQQSSNLDEATKSDTAEALSKSRQFLTQRLLPDLDSANTQHKSIVTQIQEYKKLRDTLRYLDTSEALRHTSQAGPDIAMMADVGAGVAVQTHLMTEEMPVVSLGLANFYAQLTNREARAYITKKLELLERKRDLALERLAKIEAHIHLTSTSMTQLDNLHRGGSIVDDLQGDAT